MAEDFQPIFKPAEAPIRRPRFPGLTFMFKNSFKLQTLFALGGVVQAIITLLLPTRYALLPLGLVLLHALVTTIQQARNPATNPFMVDVIPGRTTAQLPVPGPAAPGPGSPFGSVAAAQPVVTFHLGVRFNHPLGYLSPGARAMGAHFAAMATSLRARRDEYGLLGMSTWGGAERESNNTFLIIAYFRDVAGLNAFAHEAGGAHRAGWDWYRRLVREPGYAGHLGIYHETFLSGPGQYETIYVDSAPVMLGAADVKLGGGKDGKTETWVRPLVGADHAALRSQARRMAAMSGLKDGYE